MPIQDTANELWYRTRSSLVGNPPTLPPARERLNIGKLSIFRLRMPLEIVSIRLWKRVVPFKTRIS